MRERLGVSLMDDDHAALERLIGSAEDSPEAELAPLFEAIAAELAAHFSREEKAMMEARAPILFAHMGLHRQLLQEVERMPAELCGLNAEAARHLIGATLALMIEQHVGSADAVTAMFLRRRDIWAPRPAEDRADANESGRRL